MLRRGELVRLRRGAFVPMAEWLARDDRERHILRIRAVLADRQSPALVAGHSAAALHGLPVLRQFPSDVTLLRPHAGGGKSEPGVVQTSAGGLPNATVRIQGIEATTLERTTIDMARVLDFPAAVATVDWVLKNGGLVLDDLTSALDSTRLRAGRAHVVRVLEFAVAVSGSFGESMARAVIHQLGFEPPELQKEFVDAEGSMFADFFWPGVTGAAEFDGFVKFSNPEFTGADPARAMWKEKLREDRLRKQVSSLSRLVWKHVEHPQLMAAELERAGIPRRRSYDFSGPRARGSARP